MEKAFHHAPFDLRFMVHAWGVQPASIRCTKCCPNYWRQMHQMRSTACSNWSPATWVSAGQRRRANKRLGRGPSDCRAA